MPHLTREGDLLEREGQRDRRSLVGLGVGLSRRRYGLTFRFRLLFLPYPGVPSVSRSYRRRRPTPSRGDQGHGRRVPRNEDWYVGGTDLKTGWTFKTLDKL